MDGMVNNMKSFREFIGISNAKKPNNKTRLTTAKVTAAVQTNAPAKPFNLEQKMGAKVANVKQLRPKEVRPSKAPSNQ
jgi:hypothetical protein